MKNLNQSGQASPEFLFAIVVSFGLFLLFLSISLTFTIVEVGQYISYSVARAQVGSNTTPAAQLAAANAKFKQLSGLPAFGILFKSGWFVFGTPDIRQGCVNSGSTFRSALGDGSQTTCAAAPGSPVQFEQVFTGASLPFQSKLLGMQIPFLNAGGAQDDQGFQSHISAILIREPSAAECQTYYSPAVRGAALKGLPSGQKYFDQSSYFPMEDTGC